MIRLHGYWRSSASYRIRVALNIKAVDYVQVTHDLRRGEQHEEEFYRIQPQGMVPALETSDGILIQSPAILEWLEETFPKPALLPASTADRAVVRAMAAIIGCDIHPLNNLRVLTSLTEMFGAKDQDRMAWIARWIQPGFGALETMIASHGGAFAFGNTPSLADVYLVPQVYSAERFGVDLGAFPHLRTAAEAAKALPAFLAADPARQPDADPIER